MAKFRPPLPPDVQDALRRGEPLEAVRLLRETSGLGLAEAREAVEAARHHTGSPGHDRENADEAARSGSASDGRTATFASALSQGRPAEALRALRERASATTRADDAFEDARRASQAGGDGPSPGEVPRGPAGVPWLVIIVVVLLLWLLWRVLA